MTCVWAALALSSGAIYGADEVMDISLNDLMALDMNSIASFTNIEQAKMPASVTTITQEMIARSGARELSELLEIYVPNTQAWMHNFGPNKVGFRGLTSDRENKFLYIVNGVVMNHRTKLGAISEVDLPNLEDMKAINVVRGPGSAVYGSGAVSGVIAVETFSGETFEHGTQFTIRDGFREEYSNRSINHARELANGASLYVHYDITDYEGSDPQDAPFFVGDGIYDNEEDTPPALVEGGGEVLSNLPNSESAPNGALRHKLHIQYTGLDWESWLRFTRGGEQFTPQRGSSDRDIGTVFSSIDEATWAMQEYQQLAIATERHFELANGVLDLRFAFDSFELRERRGFDRVSRAEREDEYQARLLYRNEKERMSYALGAEYSFEKKGLKPTSFDDDYNISPADSSWSTNVFSPLGELQAQVSDPLTLYFSARADKHTHTKWLVSPRLAGTFELDETQFLKLIFNRSARRANDIDLKSASDRGSKVENEVIDFAEFRYDYFGEYGSKFGAALFYQDVEVLAYNTAQDRTRQIGEYNAWGLDVEYSYEHDQHRVMVGYGYTDLITFTPGPDGNEQNFSAQPYGIGDDLTHWAKHTLNMSYFYDYSDDVFFDASLRFFLDFDGAENMALVYTRDAQVPPAVATPNVASQRDITPGYDAPFRPNAYLNLGATYGLADNIDLRLEIHNALGFIDQDLNKRNFLAGRAADYQIEAPAFSIAIKAQL